MFAKHKVSISKAKDAECSGRAWFGTQVTEEFIGTELWT